MTAKSELEKLISDFVKRYRKEFDFYEQASRMASQMLDSNLASAGLRAIVTSRAKNPARLEQKIKQRSNKCSYKNLDEIFDDIVDLAGVRVALYFPGEREEVGKIIRTIFVMCDDAKQFPQQRKEDNSGKNNSADETYRKRFSGYSATHYRVQIPESRLNDSQKRYSEAKIEIQVASVLMHAWSEVEHDLVYKPLQGKLSQEEYAILDELNGLVISGEIALERLQRAGELRASTRGRPYSNHYDLTASLLDLARSRLSKQEIKESEIGRVDDLYNLLVAIGKNTPDEIEKYIAGLQEDFEKRPLAEQIIDRLLSENQERYEIYKNVKLNNLVAEQKKDDLLRRQNESLGRFVGSWAAYEQTLKKYAVGTSTNSYGPAISKMVRDLRLSAHHAILADRLWRFRNAIVHGTQIPTPSALDDATVQLNELIKAIEETRGKNA